jgi:hypothetical protein
MEALEVLTAAWSRAKFTNASLLSACCWSEKAEIWGQWTLDLRMKFQSPPEASSSTAVWRNVNQLETGGGGTLRRGKASQRAWKLHCLLIKRGGGGGLTIGNGERGRERKDGEALETKERKRMLLSLLLFVHHRSSIELPLVCMCRRGKSRATLTCMCYSMRVS